MSARLFVLAAYLNETELGLRNHRLQRILEGRARRDQERLEAERRERQAQAARDAADRSRQLTLSLGTATTSAMEGAA